MTQQHDLPRYGRVLIATDGSESAWQAALHGVALARASGGEVIALYVVDTHQAFRVGIHAAEAEVEMAREGREALNRVMQLAASHGVPARSELVQGSPKETLVDAAASEAADCLVVGTHGAGLARALLGSVSEHCSRHAPCPVLVVPQLEPGEVGPRRSRR